MVGSKKVLVVSGKRKTAIARATVRQGMGRIRVNNVPLEIYQPEIAREKILEPLMEAGEDVWKKVDINVKVRGQQNGAGEGSGKVDEEFSSEDSVHEI
jgi:ribosomal protein S9